MRKAEISHAKVWKCPIKLEISMNIASLENMSVLFTFKHPPNTTSMFNLEVYLMEWNRQNVTRTDTTAEAVKTCLQFIHWSTDLLKSKPDRNWQGKITLHVSYKSALIILMKPWKYKIRKNVNSDFSIVTMRRVVIIFFELRVSHANILIARHSMIILCLKTVLDCNSLIYK